MRTVLAWIFKHPKATVVLFSGFLTAVCSPVFLAVWAFIITTSKTNGEVPEIAKDLSAVTLEVKTNKARDDQRWEIVQGYLKTLVERDYQELREARRKGQAHQP